MRAQPSDPASRPASDPVPGPVSPEETPEDAPTGVPMVPPVVGPDDLAALGADGSALVLADVRWYLDGRDGRAAYAAGHLPGAVWVDIDNDLAAHGGPPTEGRHPLPSPEAFAAAMTRLGIGDDTVVVAYDDTGGMTAGRLVVMLRMLGRRAALLDGGLAAWPGPLDTGVTVPAPAAKGFTVTPWPHDRIVSTDALVAWVNGSGAGDDGGALPAGTVLLDARPYERFTGAVAAVDPRPGHIPGARSAPWSAVLGPDGRLRPVAELRAHFGGLGVDGASPVVVSCGSGVSACLDLLAIEHAGFAPARLFPPSWSGWSADPERPAALGD